MQDGRQNFELRKENAKLKKEIEAIIIKTVKQVTTKLEKEHQKEINELFSFENAECNAHTLR